MPTRMIATKTMTATTITMTTSMTSTTPMRRTSTTTTTTTTTTMMAIESPTTHTGENNYKRCRQRIADASATRKQRPTTRLNTDRAHCNNVVGRKTYECAVIRKLLQRYHDDVDYDDRQHLLLSGDSANAHIHTHIQGCSGGAEAFLAGCRQECRPLEECAHTRPLTSKRK